MLTKMVAMDQQEKYSVSFSDITICCLEIIEQLKEDHFVPDVVACIMRGGLIPGRLIADYVEQFGVKPKMLVVEASSHDKTERLDPVNANLLFDVEDVYNKKVLLVDDVWSSGRTMQHVMGMLPTRLADIRACVFVWKQCSFDFPRSPFPDSFCPSYFGKKSENKWIIFPWERYSMSNYRIDTENF